MTHRLQNMMLAMLLALTTLFVGIGTLSQNPTSGGYQLFERAASGISADIQLASLRNFSPSQESASEYANAPNTGPRVTVRDHYAHHDAMRNDVIGQLEGQGYTVSRREVSFGSSCGSGRCRPDIIYEAPDGTKGIIEIKTGTADLSIRQTEIYPQISSGDAIPRGQVAADFGLRPGVPLREQGYPNGIPIEIRNFPGVGQ